MRTNRCLVAAVEDRQRVALRRRVKAYPRAQQTPDFGTFAHHDHGEMVIPVLGQAATPQQVIAPMVCISAPSPVEPPRPRRRPRWLGAMRREAAWLAIAVPLAIVAAISALVASR